IRKEDGLFRAAQNVGALRHEVDAAEDEELRIGPLRAESRELERVAGNIGVLDHVVALVVVAEDREPSTKRFLGRADPVGQNVLIQTKIGFGYRSNAHSRLLLGPQFPWVKSF